MPSFFWYDNDKDVKVYFLMMRITESHACFFNSSCVCRGSLLMSHSGTANENFLKHVRCHITYHLREQDLCNNTGHHRSMENGDLWGLIIFHKSKMGINPEVTLWKKMNPYKSLLPIDLPCPDNNDKSCLTGNMKNFTAYSQ